jgi:hypothetical protein
MAYLVQQQQLHTEAKSEYGKNLAETWQKYTGYLRKLCENGRRR